MTSPLPDGFVYVAPLAPGLIEAMDYCGADNFVGRPIDGYRRAVCILSRPAAEALARAQAAAVALGLRLTVFDAYRPQRAVDAFLRWAEEPDDAHRKALYYPDIDKRVLFDAGYLARRSSHSRGSTVDLGLADAAGNPLDMGTRFDFFGPESWPGCPTLAPAQQANRERLWGLMRDAGFDDPHPQEWWHFTLRDEPYPDTWFDFPVA